MTIQKRIEDLDKKFDKNFKEQIFLSKDKTTFYEVDTKPIKKFYHQQILELIKDYGESLIGKDESFEDVGYHLGAGGAMRVRNAFRKQMRAKLNGDIK